MKNKKIKFILFGFLFLLGLFFATADSDSFNASVNITGGCINLTPDYYCSVFSDCNISDMQPCLVVSDANGCSNFTGDVSDYDMSCDFCYPVWTDISVKNCNLNRTYTQIWFSSCCNETNLNSDCSSNPITNGTEQICRYEMSDLVKITGDVIGTTGSTFVSFIPLIIIVAVLIAGFGTYFYLRSKNG